MDDHYLFCYVNVFYAIGIAGGQMPHEWNWNCKASDAGDHIDSPGYTAHAAINCCFLRTVFCIRDDAVFILENAGGDDRFFH